MPRGKPGTARPAPRRAVGLYGPFMDECLGEVQTFIREASLTNHHATWPEVIEYLYRFWKDHGPRQEAGQ